MAQLTINTDWCSKKELSVCVAGFSQEELEIRYLTELSLEKKQLKTPRNHLHYLWIKRTCKISRQHQHTCWFYLYKKWLFLIYKAVRHTRLLRWRSGKESACQCRRHERQEFDPWVGKIPWRRKWKPTPVFLPRKFHGQRSLASCYSPWGRKRIGHDWATQHKHTRSSLTPQVGKERDRMLLWRHLHHSCRTLS